MKNDTIVSVIICYDFYHNDFDIGFFLFFDENVRVWFMLILNSYLFMIIRRTHWYLADVCPRCKGVVSVYIYIYI